MNVDFRNISNEEAKEIALNTMMEIKDVVISTVDFNGNPISRIIDLMFRDKDSLYITTCKVKPFYRQLKMNNNIAITVMTKDYLQVRLQAKCEEIGGEVLNTILEKNPSFADLGLVRKDLNNMTYFCINKGKGEIFDLNGDITKVQRARFDFGGGVVEKAGCLITDKCINCTKCAKACPFDAISKGEKQHIINSNLCDECGICYYICPVEAINIPSGM